MRTGHDSDEALVIGWSLVQRGWHGTDYSIAGVATGYAENCADFNGSEAVPTSANFKQRGHVPMVYLKFIVCAYEMPLGLPQDCDIVLILDLRRFPTSTNADHEGNAPDMASPADSASARTLTRFIRL